MPPDIPASDGQFEFYLEMVSKGWRPSMAAKEAGITLPAVKKHRLTNPAFAARELEMRDQAIGRLDHKIYDAAVMGDLYAAEKWLRAHDREAWGADRKVTVENKHTIELTATREGILALEAELNKRLALSSGTEDFIEAESYEEGDTDEPLIG